MKYCGIQCNKSTIPIIYTTIKHFIEKYERRISAGALLLGFIVDNLTLTRIDLLYDNAVLLSYLILIGASIIFLNAYEVSPVRGGDTLRALAASNGASKKRSVFFDRLSLWIPIIIQFAFGGLFSGFVVFYSRSATLASNWPFVFGLIILLIGNEKFKGRYERFNFQIAIFFVGIFSYFIFSFPVLFKTLGAGVFLASGAAALITVWLIILMLFAITPQKIKKDAPALTIILGTLYFGFNLFYFTNIIPPIPLSIKELGIYHSVTHTENEYFATYEPKKWYDIPEKWNPTFHIQRNEPVYIFSSVFAPTRINANIFHQWYYFDPREDRWTPSTRIGFSIKGGADGGYRGYSFKESIWPGRWRVEVVTERNQIIGRITFTVIDAQGNPPQLIQKIF